MKQVNSILVFLVFCTFLSCASRKQMAYLQSASTQSAKEQASFEPKIQADDLLQITVSAENPEVAAPYNLKTVSVNNATGSASVGQTQLDAYLVDKNGEIDFSQIGKIQLAGLTRLEAIEKIKGFLTEYIQQPTVYLRILNFKVSVLGEVARPGVHSVSSERITLLEALSLSGDLTIYGKRKNIMVLREKDGVKTINNVDITSADFVNSPYYYLSQNDVVYVEPNKVRMSASTVGPNVAMGLSVLSMVIGIIILITR